MAIVINNAPDAGTLVAAYVAQVFEVQDEVPTGATPAALQVEVKNNGSLIETLYYPAIEVITGSPNDTCIFRVDLREVVQRLFNPNNLLPTVPGSDMNNTFTSELAFIECTFKTWLPNVDNLLELDNEGAVDSVGYRVINATRNMFEAPYMADFSVATGRKFLTSKPINGWTDLDSSEYLYAFNPSGSAFYWVFTFFNASGGLKSAMRADNGNITNKLIGKGVGGACVANTAWNATLYSDGDPAGNGLVPGVDHYFVFGSGSPIFGGGNITEIRRYNVRERCVHYRIHFLNKYGVWDFFPIRSDKGDTLTTKSDGYETTHSDNFAEGVVRRHVRQRGQVRADDGFEVEVGGVGPAAIHWLEELMMTPLAYIEKAADDIPDGLRFYPIVVRDGKLNKSDRTFTFEVIYSREKISQRT